LFDVKKKRMAVSTAILLVSLWIVAFDNFSYFRHLLEVYPFEDNPWFIVTQTVILVTVFSIIFVLLSWKYTAKAIWILFLVIAAVENYFMQTYNVLIDETMIENALQTEPREVQDLVNIRFFLYLLFLGIIPSWIVYHIKIDFKPFLQEVWWRIKWLIGSLILIAALMYPLSDYYTSFFREHKEIRFYTNPLHGMFSLGNYLHEKYKNKNIPLKQIGLDAAIPQNHKRRIVVMVVGEAVRADHFGLNGYEKETTPKLAQENVVNFTDVYSCGTTTAVSVPCMFSIYDRGEYSTFKGLHTENVLDVLHRAGVEILWRDNNSNSKGVADRLRFEDYKSPKHNPVCDNGECRDEGMLVGLEKVIQSNRKDLLIVLHQMGNHGPAYYKRYPKSYEIFKPVCRTNLLEQCSKEVISNAYDNAIRYTDTFLSKVINLLKKEANHADTAMIYLSDHGESLGEKGLYLHGLPYFIAPESQKHIPMVMWFSDGYAVDKKALLRKRHQRFSQDNIFSTLLGLFGVQTNVYKPEMDILKN
jgi:lipid A ethanolaminephosphotransferase